MSGFSTKLHGSVCYYYQSFVGRDFKGWTQMALFILGPYLSDGQKEVTAVERLVEWTAVERLVEWTAVERLVEWTAVERLVEWTAVERLVEWTAVERLVEWTAVERLVEWTAVERWKLVRSRNWTLDVGMVQLAVG